MSSQNELNPEDRAKEPYDTQDAAPDDYKMPTTEQEVKAPLPGYVDLGETSMHYGDRGLGGEPHNGYYDRDKNSGPKEPDSASDAESGNRENAVRPGTP